MQNIPQTINYENRQARLAGLLRTAGLDALILNAGPTLTYLTSLVFHLSERPIIGVFIPDRAPVLILPALEVGKLEGLPFALIARPYGEDPASWPLMIKNTLKEVGVDGAKACVEPRRFRYLEYQLLHEASPAIQLDSAERVVAALRMQKEPHEVESMRQAVRIAQEALIATLLSLQSGVSERHIAAELSAQMMRHGADAELPFIPIVASGPNSANPHAVPGDRKPQPGDMLIIDWGAAFQGYISDLTRTFSLGEPDPEFERVAEVVLEANAAARAQARPGVTAGEIDLAARNVIQQAGYGQYFIHRTGHGLGMEPHEDPYLFAGNSLRLEVGMTFTIEPGIYLPGRGGVRIEDDVVITPDGAESLSELPRELRILSFG